MRFPKLKTPRDSRYLDFIRSFPCVFCARTAEASHHGKHGMGLKPSDYNAIPLCRQHHQRWHNIGSPHFTWDGLAKEEKAERFEAIAQRFRALWAARNGENA